MASIHFIEKINALMPIKDSPGEWESGNWVVSALTAEQLIGGNIYLHRAQNSESHFGGIILSYRLKPDEPHAGRYIFRFRATSAHKDFYTTNDGWSMEKKLVGINL